MEEQLKLLDKLENELEITFECFDAEPDCPKCSEQDNFTFQYRASINIGKIYEMFGHFVVTCSGCGYVFRMLTKDTQEAYTEREDELPEDELPEDELGEEFFDLGRTTAEVAADLGLRLLLDEGRAGRVEEPKPKSKLPERMKKMFLEDEDKDKEDE